MILFMAFPNHASLTRELQSYAATMSAGAPATLSDSLRKGITVHTVSNTANTMNHYDDSS